VARPRSTSGGRPHTVCTKLSNAEAAELDALRGSLDRAAYLRWLILRARKMGLGMPEVPQFRRQ